jgi:hypothetical protein
VSQFFIATGSSILLLGLVGFFLFEYRRYRVQVLRFHLFAARDRLFESARAGNLAFDARAYGMARHVINGLIDCADRLSLADLLIMRFLTRSSRREANGRRFHARFAEARGRLSPAGQKAVDAAFAEVHFCVLSHLLHVSVIFVLPMQVIKAWLGPKMSSTKQIVSSFKQNAALSRGLDELDGNAFSHSLANEQLHAAAA